MGYYQVITHGQASGQAVQNVFWFQSVGVFEILDDLIAYEEALAAEFKQSVWDSAAPTYVGGNGMRDVMCTLYTLDKISVLGYNDDGIVSQSDAYELTVGETGLDTGETNGPQGYIRLNASLAPYFGLGLLLPKQGWLKMGPITDASVGNDSRLKPAFQDSWQTFSDRIARDLVTTSPVGVFEPIRVKLTYIPSPIPGADPIYTLVGWRGVLSWTPTPFLYQMKSRRPTA